MTKVITREQVEEAKKVLGLEDARSILIEPKSVDWGETFWRVNTATIQEPLEDGVYRLVRTDTFDGKRVELFLRRKDGRLLTSFGAPSDLNESAYHTVERISD